MDKRGHKTLSERAVNTSAVNRLVLCCAGNPHGGAKNVHKLVRKEPQLSEIVLLLKERHLLGKTRHRSLTLRPERFGEMRKNYHARIEGDHPENIACERKEWRRNQLCVLILVSRIGA
jgi:hypothetical protein